MTNTDLSLQELLTFSRQINEKDIAIAVDQLQKRTNQY